MRTGSNLTIDLILGVFILVIQYIGMFKSFQKAGRGGWEALIPIYRIWVMIKLLEKPWWYIILAVIPGVNLIVDLILNIDFAKAFGRFGFGDYLLSALFGPFYFYYTGFNPKIRYIGPDATSGRRKTQVREWADALAFALIAATIIRTFYIEAYTIPTPSMEKTLLVDDFLFVSKINYGVRIPMTPIAFPLAHNTMPFFGGKSYLDWVELPYFRLPGLARIKNYDIVVFNWPADTMEDEGQRPVDKKDNYIKRCIGIPGDSIQVIGKEVHINGKKWDMPEQHEFLYIVTSKDFIFQNPDLEKKLNISWQNYYGQRTDEPMAPDSADYYHYAMTLTDEEVNFLKQQPDYKRIVRQDFRKGEQEHMSMTFPQNEMFNWNRDFFGPLWVPKAGTIIQMNLKNYTLYREAIMRYEKNPTLTWKDGAAYIDGKLIKEYTFKMDYYFMMGDNRDNSLDSRYWGFVPEDHVVGKPVFIWLSMNSEGKGFFNKIRWNRMFKVL